MASLSERYPDNAAGDFYVDRTCIDCDACRRIAPDVFEEADDHSFVRRQPASEAERLRALMALVACPTGSIGSASRADARPGIAAFPEHVDENVWFCGFTSRDSFGAWSYFVERPEGNVLVDSPRAVPRLLTDFRRRGGVATLFLTHRDDVADHAQFQRRFGCERVLHERDVTASTASVERKLVGDEPVRLAPDLLAIPTPGH
ncbi:MAG TPA: ferredoxin, partial [Thermoanaerobaculia bacterium]